MKKLLIILLLTPTLALAAPDSNIMRNILPETTSRFDVGTSSKIFNRLFVNYASTTALNAVSLCLDGDTCRTTWPASAADGTFATTSADYWVIASTTIARTPLANLFTGIQTFVNGFLSTASSTFTVAPIFSSLTSALILTDSAGLTAEYGGASACASNNFVTTISALGGTTCGTAAISGVNLGSNLADLTATDSTLTFSGAYNGGTARTIGLNLGNANTFTALQQFGNASSTLGTITTAWFTTASTTNLTLGTGLCAGASGNALVVSAAGVVSCGAITTGAASTTLLTDNNTFSGLNIFGNASTTQFSISGASWLGTPSALVGTNITGTGASFTAGKATVLETARTINGISFDGSANIVVASTTLLANNNTFSGNNIFSASTTIGAQLNLQQASSTILTADRLFVGTNTGVTSLTGTGLTIIGGTLTNGGVVTLSNSNPILWSASGGTGVTPIWTGLATTSQPASSNLLVSNGGAGVYGVATTSITCFGFLTCTGFNALGAASTITTTGDLPVADGGTGASTLTGLLQGNGTGAITGSATINNGNWSGTDLSVANGGTGLSSFGGTNTVLFTSTADNLASDTDLTYNGTTNLLTLVNASTTNLTAGTSLFIPTSATQAPTVSGQIAQDTTDGQLKIGNASATNVFDRYKYFTIGTPATTTAWTGTTTPPSIVVPLNSTIQDVQCVTDVGTVNAQITYASTNLALLNASTTVGTVTFTTNNTPSRGDVLKISFGTPASSPTWATCSGRMTATGT